MLRIQVILGQNDIMNISEALKEIKVGGVTVTKIKGRGKMPGPEIHASKGSEIFIPQFSERYVLEVIIADENEDKTITLIRSNSRGGKIFVSQILRAIDIKTGDEGEKTI